MNVNNSHNASGLEHTASLGKQVTDYCLNNEGGKNVAEQMPEQMSSTLQSPALLNEKRCSEISSCQSKQIPKKLLKKIKKRKSQNSKPIKKWFKEKTDKDKTEETESLTDAPERENYDDEHPVSLHIQSLSRAESVLNSSILDEILSEKKRVNAICLFV
jgi:hypothetical protein